jgi:hypothetical protein
MNLALSFKKKLVSFFMVVAMLLSLIPNTASADAVMGPGNLTGYRDKTGQTFQFIVKGTTTGRIWGDGVYTDDSDLATAAVHAGVLSSGQEGIVTVRLMQGQGSYPSTTKNGVTSIAYGAWGYSYQFVGSSIPTEDVILTDPGTLTGFRGRINQTLKFRVTGTATGRIWGDIIYTDDSNLATAAVHAGALRPGEQGVVTVKILAGQSSYPSASRNGVTSISYGSYAGSYQIVTNTVPSNGTLRGTSLLDGIKLDWDRATQSGVVGYNLYRAKNSGGYSSTPVTDFYIQDLTYTDSTVLPNTTYYYIMKPVFSNGTEGAASNEVSAKRLSLPAENTITLQINSPYMTVRGVRQEIDPGRGTVPVVVNGRTLLPIRAIVESMGGTVGWDGATQKVTILEGSTKIELFINSRTAYVNGVAKELDVPAQAINSRTMVPFRFVGEALGKDVGWDGATKTVTMKLN